jgi:phospholipid/cholesterol/gamma-HCH transport system substrate-binding protein
MPQRKQIAWAQLRVGMLVVVSLVVLAAGVFFISGQVGFLSRHYLLKTYFPTASGVREGAEVRLAGIAVGNVQKIQLSPYSDADRSVEIVMRLTKNYQNQIRSDSVATIETAGLLGDGYIDITRGGQGQAVPDDGVVKGQAEADIKQIVQNANDVVSNLRVLSTTLTQITAQIQTGSGTVHQLLYDKTLYTRLNDTTAGLDRLVTQVEQGQGTLGKLMQDDTAYQQTLQSINHLNQLLDDIEHGKGSAAKFISDPAIFDNIKELSAHANTLINNINQSQGTFTKMINDPQLYDRMNSAVGRVDTVATRIEKGEGTLGKLSTDPALFNNLNDTSKSLKDFMTDFRKNPKQYLTIRMHIF